MNKVITLENVPMREGSRPRTTPSNPHMQLDQQPEDTSFIKKLMEWSFDFQNTIKRPSAISVPGSTALWMEETHACSSCNAFMIGTEFAHFHPHPDFSMHLGLTKKDAEFFIEKGWGEWHPMIKRGILPPNMIMLYAPRNEEELAVSKLILNRSYDFARGELK
ncbi:luciferase family protein [Flammeovirga sp. EKP202]|uniref:luciferase domain-containing protein n=1 Tax=Flammeovirga sp. EKP202 TaxID=2770592 RepID=UPI00165F8C9D|nr:luciferase family protein [Flammeovirga sp. EKP202]MBD0401192.1 phospholipase [Flammeovirga sp. EKP202]